jgi:hypothetical protein
VKFYRAKPVWGDDEKPLGNPQNFPQEMFLLIILTHMLEYGRAESNVKGLVSERKLEFLCADKAYAGIRTLEMGCVLYASDCQTILEGV